MKLRVLASALVVTAVMTASSNAVTVTLAGVTNDSLGRVTVDGSNATGTAVFVSSTSALSGIAASMNALLGGGSTLADFDLSLTSLIGATSATSPGDVRRAAFTDGILNSAGPQEMGDAGNNTYLFLVGLGNGDAITGIGAYTGANVPPLGAVVFNPNTAGDGPGVGTSPVNGGFVLSPAVPEPSIALLGALGVFGLIRRRR